MLGNSRELHELKSPEQDQALRTRLRAGEEPLQDCRLTVSRWPEARRSFESSAECPAQIALNLIHGKWKTRILSRLQYGPARLGELRRLLPQASKKMLAQHLREMERDGLVVRKNLSGRVLHVEYSLSESGGHAALQLIRMLQHWSNEHLPFRTKELI